jgi:hypothetical protein
MTERSLKPFSAIMPDTSLSAGDLLVHSLSYDLDRPVVQFSDTGRIVTAREFRDVVSQYAQALNSRGSACCRATGLKCCLSTAHFCLPM